MTGALSTETRLRALLKANQVIVEQLDLPVVLKRIVEAAVELVGARYGALGVVAPNGSLDQFIHVGMSPEDVARIGHLPEGHGLLGAVIDDPHPIRLDRIGDDVRSSGFPAGHPPMESFLGVPVRVRNEVYGNLYLSNQRSGRFNEQDEQLVTALAASAGVAIENARLFAETRRRQAWSAASAEITAALLSEDQSHSFALLVTRVLALSGADLTCVLLPTPDPAVLVVDTITGVGENAVRGAHLRASSSIAGSVIEGRQPALQDDSAFVLPGGIVLGPVMAVPLISFGRAEGVLLLARVAGGTLFSSADLEMAADFAGQASVAMRLGAARADRQRLAVLEDRARIARDLHDHVIQQLFGTGLELQSIAGGLPPGEAAARIQQAIENLDGSISQIRTVIFSLSTPVESKTVGVRRSIIDIANGVAPELANAPYVTFSGPVDLLVTGDLADDVCAVVREALTNVARHASAEHTSVRLRAADRRVVLEITDDGGGVSANGRQSGLANLRVRAELRGGTFEVTSGVGGTHLSWSVPLSLENTPGERIGADA